MGIHGGRRFLINARFAACHWELIARRGVPNPAPNQPYFGRRAIQFLLKSAGGCRLVIQLTQWCTSTSVMFFLLSPPPFSFCCLQPRRGEERTSSVANYLWKQTRREQLEEKFCLGTLLLLKFDAASENEPTVRGLDFLSSFAPVYSFFLCLAQLKTWVSRVVQRWDMFLETKDKASPQRPSLFWAF